ncbi:MAG TPA: hypothetical protein VL380_01945 [Nitrosospira sp.]|jgi:hypothetical protein|nr:hypothetical protein [Nitrosospira sp.]
MFATLEDEAGMISYCGTPRAGSSAQRRFGSPFLTVHGWQSESGVKHLIAKRLAHAICWEI